MLTKVYDYGMNGEGVARIEGKISLIPFAMKDEMVDIEIEHEYSNYTTAKLISISSSCENREIPKCPYYAKCGGCQLQHMQYSEQLEFKKDLVRKTIKKILGLDYEVHDTVESNKQYEYRNKASFSIQNKTSGFFEYNSKDIVSIDRCPLLSLDINRIYSITREYILSLPYVDDIKNIVIRSIDSQHLVGIVTRKTHDFTSLYTLLKKEFDIIGLYEILNTRNDSVVLYGKVTHISGIKEILVSSNGLNYPIDIIGFHQTNIDVQDKLYDKVCSYISPNSVVLNGFSGAGLLSAIIAKRAKHVYAIEIDKNSHNSAETLKKNNNISNLTNICGDFYSKFRELSHNFDTIVLDPSKKGCGEKAMKYIKGIKYIIYISCNPIAMCKDLRHILDAYEIEEIVPFDMFPNTKNLETLVKLKYKE